MPNVTISVTDELKAEMDKFPEVSWSEICRKAILRYIEQRKNPTPKIELELRNATLTHSDIRTGGPTLALSLRIHNKMDSEITVDRIILSDVLFAPQDGSRSYGIGFAYDFHKRNINANAVGGAMVFLALPKWKIDDLKDAFNSTFNWRARCTVYVEGFKNEYNTDMHTRIPIDDWKSVVKKVLKKPQTE